MFHMLAVIALAAAASSTPCPVVSVSQDAVQESVAVAADFAQELALEEATQIAEYEFAARVKELGLTGAAPLFGTVPDTLPAKDARLARRADARGPRR